MALQKELPETVPAALPNEVLSPKALRQRALDDLRAAIELAKALPTSNIWASNGCNCPPLWLGRGDERRDAR
jgi:hypothetical protein